MSFFPEFVHGEYTLHMLFILGTVLIPLASLGALSLPFKVTIFPVHSPSQKINALLVITQLGIPVEWNWSRQSRCLAGYAHLASEALIRRWCCYTAGHLRG